MRVRPAVPMVLYALLAASAAMALYSRRAPGLSPVLAAAAPWLFVSFATGFAGYRLALVFDRRYRPFKAFAQIGLAALVAVLLLTPQLGEVTRPQAQPPRPPLATALADPDARVRALAAELVGWRSEAPQAAAVVRLLDDADATVRSAAHASLVRLNAGVDLGPDSDASAKAAWRERFP